MYRSVKFPVALTGTGSILAARRLPLRETVTKYGVQVVHGLPGQGCLVQWELVGSGCTGSLLKPRPDSLDATHGESMLVLTQRSEQSLPRAVLSDQSELKLTLDSEVRWGIVTNLKFVFPVHRCMR